MDNHPPHSREIELGIIGCILDNAEVAFAAIDAVGVHPSAFYDLRCRQVFKTCIDARSEGQAVSLLTIHHRLKLASPSSQTNWHQLLDGAVSGITSAHECITLAEQLVELHRRRVALDAVRRLTEAVQSPSPGDALADAQSAVQSMARVFNCHDLSQAVILPGGDVTITECALDLFARIAPSHRIFRRGKVVVSLQKSMTGTLVLEPVRPSAARSLLEGHAKFVGWRVGRDSAKVLKPSILSEDTAHALLDCQAGTDLLPSIAGVVNCSVIVEKAGALTVCTKGFSLETGLLVTRGDAPVNVPLPEAIEALLGLLSEFHFQSEGDKSRALASFITPALKMAGLVRGFVPADVAEADLSQSGKTYRQKLLAAIYGETPAIVPLKKNGVGSVDESLFEKLVNGRPFIQFDNFRGALDSPALEAFLTAEGSFPCRVPNLREIEVDPSRFFILLTSNGVETTRDMANRSSIVRIFKREGVAFKDTLEIVKARQPYFLGCVFSVIREWHRRGKPRTQETNHDFREWCQTLDYIVQMVCGLAPLMEGHRAAQERVSNPVLTFLRRVALEVAKEDLLGVPVITSRLFDLADAAGIEIPGLRPADAHDGEKARKVIGQKLGVVFKRGDHIDLDGFVITRGTESHDRPDGNGARELKTYTFDQRAKAVSPLSPLSPQGVARSEKQDTFPNHAPPCGDGGEPGKAGAFTT